MSVSANVSVLVADSRRLLRELLVACLTGVAELRVTSGSSDFEDVIAQSSARTYDVILLGGDAYPRGLADAVIRIRAAAPESAVLVVVDSEEDELLLEGVEAGAAGFVTVTGSLAELTRRTMSAHANETIVPPQLTSRLLARSRRRSSSRGAARPLTSREREILSLLTDGLGNAEIANRVGVSANTIKNHLYSIYRKLGVNSRSQAFAEASRLGLVRR